MAATPSIIPSSMLTVDDLGAGLDLLAGDGQGRRMVLGLDGACGSRPTGDIRPLADVDEEGCPR